MFPIRTLPWLPAHARPPIRRTMAGIATRLVVDDDSLMSNLPGTYDPNRAGLALDVSLLDPSWFVPSIAFVTPIADRVIRSLQ